MFDPPHAPSRNLSGIISMTIGSRITKVDKPKFRFEAFEGVISTWWCSFLLPSASVRPAFFVVIQGSAPIAPREISSNDSLRSLSAIMRCSACASSKPSSPLLVTRSFWACPPSPASHLRSEEMSWLPRSGGHRVHSEALLRLHLPFTKRQRGRPLKVLSEGLDGRWDTKGDHPNLRPQASSKQEQASDVLTIQA